MVEMVHCSIFRFPYQREMKNFYNPHSERRNEEMRRAKKDIKVLKKMKFRDMEQRNSETRLRKTRERARIMRGGSMVSRVGRRSAVAEQDTGKPS